MDDLTGREADGGKVLYLSLHGVEMIVESPGLVDRSQSHAKSLILDFEKFRRFEKSYYAATCFKFLFIF